MPQDFYDLLDVDEDATREEVRAAFRAKARKYHPDVNDDERASAQFKIIRKAHETLTDPEARKTYDRLGHEAYVEKRLGGLPTRQTSESDASTSQRTRTASRTGPSRQTSSTSSASSTSSSRSSSRTASQSRSSRERTASSERRRSRGPTSSPTASRPGSGSLGYAWVVMFLVGAVYLAGAGVYLAANAGAVTSFLNAVRADPATALVAAGGLSAPLGYALTALRQGTLGVLFPIAVVAAPLVFAGVVARYGRGTAWLYVLASLAPLAAIGVTLQVTVPTAALLLALALPALAVLVFLGDVGRYLLAR